MAKISPGGAVFGRDMIFNFQLRVDWENVARKRDRLAAIGNERENSKQKEHTYAVGDKVLIVRRKYKRTAKIATAPTEGPFEIIKIYKNGTVQIERNNYYETINIRRLKPFHSNTNNEAEQA